MKTLAYRVLHLILIIMIVLLSGCGMFRKVFKTKEYSKLETKSEIRKDSVGLIVDKSVTTIKEKIDTVISIPEKVIKQNTYLNMDSLVNGMTAIKNDVMDLRLIYNPVTGILSTEATIKEQKIKSSLDRITTTVNDITQQSKVTEDKKESKKEESGLYLVQKEPASIWSYVIGLGILIFVAVSIYFWLKNRYPFS